MPFNKPVLIFDGDCGFCRRWVMHWQTLTADRVLYLSFQEAAGQFPIIPPEDFQKAVQLVEPDGQRSSAAEAVFRVMSYAGYPFWSFAYQKILGFSRITEFLYGIVAGHRPAFSTLSRWLWGNSAEPSSYRMSRWVFLRGLSVIYVIAFASLAVQVKGLMGVEGIFPSGQFLESLSRYGSIKWWYIPSLAWFNSSDHFLIGLCVAGVMASLLVFVNVLPRLFLLIVWLLYLSLVSVGGDFMNFQWDALLLETGFLAIFLAPSGFLPQKHGAASPPSLIRLLVWWLLFRLMFQSALVKWMSGDPLWHHLTALTVHYETQPIPNPVAWYAHQLPLWFQKFSCAGMFVIEGLIPFFIFCGRRLRHLAFWAWTGFQVLILSTGNYAFFNWLTIILGLMLFDDALLRRWLPSWCDEPIIQDGRRRPGLTFLFVVTLFLTSVPFARILGMAMPSWIVAPVEWVSPLRSFNSYGLFAVMTPNRPEIILEGSNDGKKWHAYEFTYKPGDPARRPPQVAPYQPRLDWQMWFAALGDYRQNPWFINFCFRILKGSEPVLRLLANNPFPQHPPVYLRAVLYEYRFTTVAERHQTGHWWRRDPKGLYCPVLSLKQ